MISFGFSSVVMERQEKIAHLTNLATALADKLLPALRQYIGRSEDRDTVAASMLEDAWSHCTNRWVAKIAGHLYNGRSKLLSPSKLETCSVAEMWLARLLRLQRVCLWCASLPLDEGWDATYEQVCELAEYLALEL